MTKVSMVTNCFLVAGSLLVPSAVVGQPPDLLSPAQLSAGWIELFDGQSLFGWQPTSEANWKVVDGVIRVTEGEPGFLMTTTEFANYELHVEFQATAGTNSGIFLRTPLVPTDPQQDCYELNIAPPDNPFPTGSLVGRVLGGSVPKVTSGEPPWHEFLVRAEGPRIVVHLDGRPVVDYDDLHPILRGRIGLQFREGAIAFRNVWLRPLGLESILNGRDISGWDTNRAEKSRFEVTKAGELCVTDGPGQLESEGTYGDFVLQLECFVAGDGLNSGIFFRCIPGDMMNGYESQIQNGFRDGDLTQPVDCGTGGIFRRQNARRVIARDHAWFTKTISADGHHMAVWVDGYPVSDWTDTRPPHANPRKGRRKKPGTLAIQGHDPTTDLRFRNFRIGELPPARSRSR
jgi:hypothetical protein